MFSLKYDVIPDYFTTKVITVFFPKIKDRIQNTNFLTVSSILCFYSVIEISFLLKNWHCFYLMQTRLGQVQRPSFIKLTTNEQKLPVQTLDSKSKMENLLL